MNGKGSKRRPMRVTQKEFDQNWFQIFDKPKLLKAADRVRDQANARKVTEKIAQILRERGQMP